MTWQAIGKLRYEQLGGILALLIVAFIPNFGIEKYGPSSALPAALLALIGMWLAWKERRALFDAPAQKRWALIALLLFIPILVSVPGSYHVRYSASVAAAMLVYYFTGAALIRVLQTEERRAWLAKWTTFVLVFWLADSLVQFIFGRDLFGLPLTPDGRVTGPFEGNLRQALFLAMLLPVTFGWFLAPNRSRVWMLLLFTTAIMVALLSGVRMVLVMLAIVAAGLFIHLPRFRWKWPMLALLPVLAALAIGLSPTLKQRMSLFTDVQQIDFATMDRLLSYRAGIWETGINMMLARPLTGIGAGAFEKAYKDHATRPDDIFASGQGRVYHAHQIYVSFAAETGLPGLAALIVIVVLGIRWYWSAPPARRPRAWPYALALAVYFFPLNTQPPLFNHWLFPVLVLLLAALLAALDDPEPDRTAEQRV